jgi:hypothetical protein
MVGTTRSGALFLPAMVGHIHPSEGEDREESDQDHRCPEEHFSAATFGFVRHIVIFVAPCSVRTRAAALHELRPAAAAFRQMAGHRFVIFACRCFVGIHRIRAASRHAGIRGAWNFAAPGDALILTVGDRLFGRHGLIRRMTTALHGIPAVFW